jgi:hypothetical protein
VTPTCACPAATCCNVCAPTCAAPSEPAGGGGCPCLKCLGL